ncbi:sugar phosphate isomerase/epimerase family protein [Microbispora triticiradicis]|uniref:Sugar phosphate isomerase/epimerase n=2 Tax=Microbispora TaxID=2005 RepID=A0ABY3LTW2_9ACTN|nr:MULTISPECIES: sugar phosphate isomerase/epimerase family protein [Microbispora]TLP52156.1 sugar phosphate isomerase/epimerase [Microbispora fusca]TYB54431.1 sugar phosphate isomerase/epimerase [Microbispora tritici]GLW25026.1 3-dehydroshikimate dehydratase [Microbispora amethystogenes]
MTAIERLSLNQWTTRRWSVREAVDGCVRHEIPAIGLWREAVAEHGLAETATLVTDAGLRVSSLCRGGFLTGPDRGLDDNRAAIDEAAALGAACLVLVVGGLPGMAPGGARGPGFSRDLADARARVADALTALVPYAAERGVRLALEPLHPMYCADRAVLSTLAQALDLAEPYPTAQVGVVVDTFHLWWDPEVLTQIERAGDRIASYQVSDFLVPLPADTLLGRGMMGDGVIDFHSLTAGVEAAGYRGDIEVEIFNADIWTADPDHVLSTMKRRFARYVSGCVESG